MRKIFSQKVIIFFLVLFLPVRMFSETKTVNVGWYIQSKYQEITDSGSPYGFNYDYLHEITEYTDWKFNFILDSFENCLEMLEKGEIDILGCIIQSDERRQKFNFPEIPIGVAYRYLYTTKSRGLNSDNFADQKNLKIAVINNSINLSAYYDYATEQQYNEHTLVGCDNTYIMERMLNDNYVDAAISGTLPDISTYEIIAEFSPQLFYFVLNKNRKDLLEDMNYALLSINFENPHFSNELNIKYGLSTKAVEIYTSEELDFINSLDTLNVAWTPLWTPLEIEDRATKEFSGYIREIFDEISNITGIKFNYIKCKTTEEALSLVMQNKVDIISLYEGSELSAKQNDLYITNPIISLPLQIIKKNSLDSDIKKVGVVHSEKTYNPISGISNYDLIRYISVPEALDAVKKEDILFLITNAYTAHYYLQNYKYSSLYGVTLQENPINLHIGISNMLPENIVDIFNKALKKVPTATKNDILIQSSIKSLESEVTNIIDIIELIPSPVILAILVLILAFTVIVSILLSKRIRYSQYLRNQLFTDELTNILTKEGFDWLVSKRLEKSFCDSYCIISFDIEHFEHYNALFGFAEGDELLKTIAKTCVKYCQKDELCAHLNSDHFVLFINEKEATAEDKIELIKKTIQNQYTNYKLFLNFGVYRLSSGIAEPAKMRDFSKAALRTIKTNSTKYIGYYDYELHSRLIQDSIMASEMENALANNEFVAYFQPKYGCSSEKPVGAEALVRWKKKDNTIVSPGEFIPLFERNGFILKLDMYIFEESCKVIAKQISSGISPVPISTNFSRIHMYNRNFAKNLAEIAGKYDIPPYLLEIEITESAFSANANLLLSLIESLHGYGFLVSIDDFGSGYSSLNLIKEMRFDVIKIDRVFFRTNSEIERTKSIIQCILSLAKELGMSTVAEGVETEDQFKFLKENECDTIQGFYFSKPLEETLFTQLLASNDSADI